MSTLVTRSGKGSPLTHNEVDTNFTNLNTDKVEKTSADITGGTINNTTIGATTPSTGVFTTLTATTAGTTTAKVWSNTGTTPIADLELQRGTTSTWGGNAFTDYRIRASGGNFILQSQNNATAVLDLLTVDETNNAIKFSPVGVEQMRVTRTASAVNYVQVTGAATGGSPTISAQGSDANPNLALNPKGSGNVVITPQSANAVGLILAAPSNSTSNSARLFFDSTSGVSAIANIGGNQLSFRTAATIGSSSGSVQALVSHTASAVNYVQVTGNATTSRPVVSAQGSDANIGLNFASKGNRSISFLTNSVTAFDVLSPASGVNYVSVTGTITGVSPIVSATGTDTNIDLTLTPKGTGNVRFGTYTASILTPTGYVEIKDSGGTVRRLLVG